MLSQSSAPKNLVPNPSFEQNISKRGDINGATPWVGVGTVDYYVKPEKRDTSRYKGARTGTCYAGLRFQKEYKEFMYVPLKEPLKEGGIYHFEMFVRVLLFDNVTVTIKQLGGYFSKEPYTENMKFEKENIVDSTNINGLAGTRNWIRIKGDYFAEGGEKYLILGNFRPKMKDDFVKNNKMELFAFEEGYYYVDDVSLYLKGEQTDSVKKAQQAALDSFPDTFTANQTIELKNIYFEENNARILRNSNKTLNALAKILNEHPFMEIQVNVKSGNISLSKQRAKSIEDYFKTQGVINPIKYKASAYPKTDKEQPGQVDLLIIAP